MRAARLRHVLLLLIVLTTAIVIYARTQPQMQMLGGKGYDGTEYSRVYQQLQGSATTAAAYPFCQRIGVPWLAAHLVIDETRAFLRINVVGGAVAILFCFLALLERVPPRIAWFSIVLMIGGIFSPIRFSFFYPFLVDGAVMACYAIAVWLFGRRLFVPSILVLAASGVFKESGVYFAMLFAVYAVIDTPAHTRRRAAIVLFGLCAASFVMNRVLAAQFCGPGSALWLVMTNTYIHLRSPWGIVATAAGISLTAGPFMFGWIYRRAEAMAVPALRSPFFAAGVLAFIMAFAAGSDISRIFFVAYPLYVLYFAEHARTLSSIERLLLLGAGLTANRILERLPDEVLPAADPNIKSFFNFVPDHSSYSVALTLLAFWWITYAVIDRMTRRQA